MAENGTTLAKAYVQIMPSAQGIKGNLAEALGGDAASVGQSWGQKLAGSIKGVITAAGIGAALGKTLTEGAALEQSIGGVETLFKGSADRVIAAADNAYRTAGVSANSYMEQVTSFSATLLQGLGGDTEAAASYADKAIVQMSDNANKMGTDMSAIQYAYQGFAKDNYTMLDNLKLGYGGTQAEMARLINDSGVLGDSIQVTAETVKDVPFSSIIDAIGVIQDDLGITGTTAQEAATTLSGSFASMQAAAKNVLADLTLGRDIGPALDGLAQTVTTFLTGNLLPAVGNILSALPGALVTFIQTLGPQLEQGIVSGLSAISPQLGAAVESAFGFLKDNGNLIAAAIVSITSAFAALKALNIATSIGSAIVTVAKGVTTFIAAARNASSIFALLQGAFIAFANPVAIAVAAVAALAGGFIYLWNTCEPFKQFWLDLGTNIANFVSNAGQAIVNFFTVTLPQTFSNAVTAVSEWGSSMISNAITAAQGFVTNVATFLQNLPYNIGYILGTALANVVNWATQMWNNAQTMGMNFLNAVVTFFTQLPMNIQNFLTMAQTAVMTWATNLVQTAITAGTNFLMNVTTFFSQLPARVATFLTGVITQLATWVTEMGQKAADAASRFETMLMDGLSALPEKVVSIGRNIVEGLWQGIQNAGDWLRSKISGFVDGIVNGFNNNLDSHSPSRVMRDQVGKWIPLGIAEGISRNLAPLRSAMQQATDMVAAPLPGPSLAFDAAARWQPAFAGPGGAVGGSPQQTFIFNQPVQTPDEFARAVRVQQTYGLAGGR